MGKGNMSGTPCIIQPGAILLVKVWMCVMKQSVKRRLRNTYDGYPLTWKGIQYAKYYAACAYQHIFDIFLILLTSFGLIIMSAGAINFYARATLPNDSLYVYFYDQLRYWYGVHTKGFCLWKPEPTKYQRIEFILLPSHLYETAKITEIPESSFVIIWTPRHLTHPQGHHNRRVTLDTSPKSRQ